MVARESSIERAGQALLREAGYVSEKRGRDGWPDREVFVAPGRHEWVEWKRPGGRLTPAQERRIPKMRARGERVWVVDSLPHISVLIAFWRSVYGPPA